MSNSSFLHFLPSFCLPAEPYGVYWRAGITPRSPSPFSSTFALAFFNNTSIIPGGAINNNTPKRANKQTCHKADISIHSALALLSFHCLSLSRKELISCFISPNKLLRSRVKLCRRICRQLTCQELRNEILFQKRIAERKKAKTKIYLFS